MYNLFEWSAYERVSVVDFKAGDIIRVIRIAGGLPDTGFEHEIVKVDELTIYYIPRYQKGPFSTISISNPRSAFLSYTWAKECKELAYDPNQQPDQEDDL